MAARIAAKVVVAETGTKRIAERILADLERRIDLADVLAERRLADGQAADLATGSLTDRQAADVLADGQAADVLADRQAADVLAERRVADVLAHRRKPAAHLRAGRMNAAHTRATAPFGRR